MPDIYLKLEPIQFRKGGGGTNLLVFACMEKQSGSELCTQVDGIKFNMKERKDGKPYMVRDAISKAFSGEYEEFGCKRLGYNWKNSSCVEKKAPKKEKAKTKGKKEGSKTVKKNK